MTDNRTTELKHCIKCIDDMTDDLLEIADVLEEHQINVKLDNGRYLNLVSAIRSKVDVIWDETQAIAATLGSERERALESKLEAEAQHAKEGWELAMANEKRIGELEELVRDMDAALIHNNCYRWCESQEPCNLISDGKCQYRERMSELGIKVITDER